MAGHSRSKNGVDSLAYVPAIHVLLVEHRKQDVDARHSPGMTVEIQGVIFCHNQNQGGKRT